jgi:hypothetical protein
MPFQTDSLPLASFLFTAKKLKFVGCQPNGPRLVFVFDDPENLGESLQIALEPGAECPTSGGALSPRDDRFCRPGSTITGNLRTFLTLKPLQSPGECASSFIDDTLVVSGNRKTSKDFWRQEKRSKL